VKKDIWYYISLIPSLAAVIGLTLAYTSYIQRWGGDNRIATVIAVFFCEIVMVIAVFGAITCLKQEKTASTKRILFLNIAIAITGALSGIYLFLG